MQSILLFMMLILLTGLLYMFGFIGQSSTDNTEPPVLAESRDGDADKE